MTKQEFMRKQLDIIAEIEEGNKTWKDLNDYRAEYIGEREHVDSTRRSARMLRDYLSEGFLKQDINTVELETAPTLNNKKAICVNSDGSCTSEGRFCIDDETQLRDPEFLLKLHDYDPTQWEVVNSKASLWDIQVKGGDIKTLYSSKITVRPKKGSGLSFEEIERHFNEFSRTYKYDEITPKQYSHGSQMLVPCLFDIHFAKLAHYGESGENYDYKIAKERVLRSVDEYINRFKDRRFEKIVFPIGNDFFNCEPSGGTVNNTPQSNDLRYSKMFEKGVETLIEAINKFAQLSFIEVILVQGNHSTFTEFYAGCYLAAWYRNSKFVSVDKSATLRKYVEFGNNLIGFTHGSEEKDRIFGLMQHEALEAWGRVGNNGSKEWLVGHLHSEGVIEKNGVVVRRIPSLTGNDQWHYKVGFTTSKKRTMAFIYDKENGLVETHYVNI